METSINTNILCYDRKLEILKDILHEFKLLTREDKNHLKDLEETQMELQYKLNTLQSLSEKTKEFDGHLSNEFFKKAEQVKNELDLVEIKISDIMSSPLAVKMIKEEIAKVELK